MLATGSVIDGRYEILARLGVGGMGEVYRARRVLLGDDVAIKVIRAAGEEGAVVRQRFLRESRACAQLRHPGIVSILDFNIGDHGEPYLVMELLSGPSLREELAERGALPLDRVQQLASDLCPAIQMAHDRGFVHRDLKPANIVTHRFDSGEQVSKVIDFGLANLREGETDGARLTAAQEFVGTVTYASPEQLQGEAVDGRTDLYSLGVVFFEALVGRPPFEGPTMLAVITRHLCDEPPRPSAVRPDLPHWVDDVLLRALAKKPGDRWPSVAAFGRALLNLEATAIGVAVAPAPGVPSGVSATYELGEVINKGRFGSRVYAATHRALGVQVAVRVLPRGAHPNWDAARLRFLREARALQVAHPSIIQVRDFGEDAGGVYLVTDFIDSVSLREYLGEHEPVDWSTANRFVSQLADATAALHKRGGLVCGLNPDIIRVAREEEGPRLMISSGGVGQIQDVLGMLSDQTLRGGGLSEAELPYLAPEVFLGQPADATSDLFTIGALAFEILTGRLPYQGRTLPELQAALLGGRPPDARSLRPDLPPALSELIARSLARDRSERPGSAAEFLRVWHGI